MCYENQFLEPFWPLDDGLKGKTSPRFMQKSSCCNNTSEISINQIINAPDEVIEVNDSVNYTRSNPTTDVNVAINSGIPNNGYQRSDRQNKPTAQLNNLLSFEARTPKFSSVPFFTQERTLPEGNKV